MTRLLVALVASLIAIPLMTAKVSAQSGPAEAEAFCLQYPTQPDCRAFMLQYCAWNPDESVCLSDDDDDD